MKILISATLLALASSSAIAAESWWGGFGNNSDIDPAGFSIGQSQRMAQPSANDVTVSLDEYGKGNPDLYAGYGYETDFRVRTDTASFITSLDKFTSGNPDTDTGPGLICYPDRSGNLAVC